MSLETTKWYENNADFEWPRDAMTMAYHIATGINLEMLDFNDRTPLFVAAEIYNIELVRLLLQHGADVNGRSGHDCTALHVAARVGADEIIELLISAGADVNAVDADNWTPLHEAASMDMPESTFILLLNHGADTDIVSNGGYKAINLSENESVRQLLSGGGLSTKSASR